MTDTIKCGTWRETAESPGYLFRAKHGITAQILEPAERHRIELTMPDGQTIAGGYAEIHQRAAELLGKPNYYESGGDAAEPKTVKDGWVVKLPSGRKYVAAKDHPLPDGAEIVADRPHGDDDFSYLCGRDYCRCMQ